MQGYILLWHGSKLASSNDENYAIYNILKQKIPNLEIAFLELTTPLYEDAIENLVKKEIEHIIVLPLFLAAGKHVKEDIPSKSIVLEEKFGIKITLLEHIGARDEYLSIIEKILKTTPSF